MIPRRRPASPLVRAVSTALLCAVSVPGQQTAPDRAAVVFRPEVFPERAELLTSARGAVLAGTPRPDLVRALERASADATAGFRSWVEGAGGKVHAVLWSPHAALVELPPARLPEIAGRADVAHVHLDRDVAALIGTATNGQNHNADLVHQRLGVRGQGVALALIDSGVNVDFQGTGIPHPAFMDGAGNSRVLLARDVVGAGTANDVNGHGTEVAAVAVGTNWNPSNPLADDGFAPQSSVISYRVTRTSTVTATVGDLALGYQAALADRIAGLPVAVANCSYAGSPDPLQIDQLALDALAEVGDVLVVTSAGNDALLPLPTAESQANLNGLAVGSVAPNTHLVSTSFSSSGPIAGDGARFFPDLMAVGEGLATVVLNSSSVATGRQGTSYSAPMVAGTALLVRGARPDFTALDTKAVLLNSVADLSPQNPSLGRNHYGLGLLRTDLAVQAARAARSGNAPPGGETWTSRIEHGVLSPAGVASQRFPLTVAAGVPHAATVAWYRTGQSASWDDLDLLVLDDRGDLVALSATPRNLYERVRFTPDRSGIFTLEVRGTTLTSSAVEFSLAMGINDGGGVQEGFYSTFGAACLGSAGDLASPAQPPGAATAFGGERTRIGLASMPTILHQGFDATWFPQPFTVQRLGFRRAYDFGAVPSWRAELSIRLGYTLLPVGALDTVLANNPVPGSMVTVVPRQWVSFHGLELPPATPAQFDFAIPLTTPFAIDAAQNGNLLLEITLWRHDQGLGAVPAWLDAMSGPGLGRVYSLGTAPGSFVLRDPLAMVVSFAATGLPPVVPRLTWEGAPHTGTSFAITLRDAAPGSLAALTFGRSVLQWGGLPLPLDLGPWGAPGCSVFASIDGVATGTTDTGGQGRFDVPIPADSSLTGTLLFHQAFLLDSAANTLGLVSTEAGFGVIGG